MASFDVVSVVDMQEVDNAVNQTKKEINTRYDFKNSKSSIEYDKTSITLLADDKMKLQALTDILKQKMSKRGVGLRALDYKTPEEALSGSLKQKIELRQGISQDDGRKIVKLIKDQKFKKVSAQIQQDQVRVNGPKKDVLQDIINLLTEKIPLELQFVNYKD